MRQETGHMLGRVDCDIQLADGERKNSFKLTPEKDKLDKLQIHPLPEAIRTQ